jgi:hypothetical protein
MLAAAASPAPWPRPTSVDRLPADPAGRHRRESTPRSRVGRAVDVVGRVGSLVTLAALMVLAATAGGLVDGMPASGAAVTATFDGSGNP